MSNQKKISTPTIRLAHPLAFSAFLRHIGAPVERHMRKQGLPTLCIDPNSIVPLNRAWRFFDAVAKTEDIDIGWHVGRYMGDHNLNHKLLRKLECTQTLYLALKYLIRMISSEASDLQLGILERNEYIVFYTYYPGKREEAGYMISQAYQIEVYVNLIRHFTNRNWMPPEIGLESSFISPHLERHFPETRICTNQQMGYLTIPRPVLHLSARSNHLITDVTSEKEISPRESDFLTSLRAIVPSYLPDGYLSEQTAARLMEISTRTLTRRLAECGLSYGKLLDEIRFKIAAELLHDPCIKTTEIARQIGIADQSNFTKMFRRISGLTPRQYRHLLMEN